MPDYSTFDTDLQLQNPSTLVYATIGKVHKVAGLEVENATVATGNSSGWDTVVSSRLKKTSPFDVDISFIYADFSPLATLCHNGTLSVYRILYPDGSSHDFSAILSKYKMVDGDNDDPAHMRVTLTFKISGVVTLSNSPAATWSDDVRFLSIQDGDFTLGSTTGTKQLVVWCIHNDGMAENVPDYTDLTFASSDGAKASVSATGLVTGIATGPSTISVSITSHPNVDVKAVCTVP